MEIIGNDWSIFSFKSTVSPSISSKKYNAKDIYDIYRGNICLDLGSLAGSISLYHRSIQIIEAGGLIIQSKQNDSKEMWGNLDDKLIFNNINEAIMLLEKIITDKNYSSSLCDELYNKFNKSESLIEKSLDKVFNKIVFKQN